MPSIQHRPTFTRSENSMVWVPFFFMNSCNHKSNLHPHQTLLYCLATSSFFVTSLYMFVPSSVRKLPRDDPLHIKWRSAVIIAVVIICLSLYPWLFCQATYVSDEEEIIHPPFYIYLGIHRQQSWTESITQDFKILSHVMILYTGSFACTWMRIYHYAYLNRQTISHPMHSNSIQSCIHNIFTSFHQTYLQSKQQSLHLVYTNKTVRWIQIRNLLLAPIAEEIIFRSLLLPPLLNSGYTPNQSCWIAPTFFGVAHFHHYYMKRYDYSSYAQLFSGLLLQWSYTTLFGAYASYVFVKTGSLFSICMIHSFCNYMGLPELRFLHRESMLFGYKWFIGGMYLVGVVSFWSWFGSTLGFFPVVSVLPDLLSSSG